MRKIDVLAGLEKYDSALEFANARSLGLRALYTNNTNHLSRGSIHRYMGD
jgi:hypothetical protein